MNRPCHLIFTEDLCREPKRLEQCLCVDGGRVAACWLNARKRDAGATRALAVGESPLGLRGGIGNAI